jgi:hypothetical protein
LQGAEFVGTRFAKKDRTIDEWVQKDGRIARKSERPRILWQAGNAARERLGTLEPAKAPSISKQFNDQWEDVVH